MKTTLLLAVLTLSLVGCNKKTEAGSAAPGAKADALAAASGNVHKIEKLGLSFQMPDGVEVGEVIEVMGSYTYPTGSGSSIQVNPYKAGGSMSDDFEAAKASVKDFQDPKLTRSEKTSDGWRVEYDHDSGTGRTFKVLVRRSFGKDGYDCEANANDAKTALVAAKGCESLKSDKRVEAVAAVAGPAAGAAAAPGPTEAKPAAGASCEKAVRCCRLAVGDKSPACDPLAGAVEASCANSLKSFKKVVKASKPKLLAQCN